MPICRKVTRLRVVVRYRLTFAFVPGDIQPPLNLEDTDIMRHREITSKAVSAILILTLRWFKVSHAMKFHYLAHLLVDSNCLLLVLKMFGLQEVSNQVRMKNEVEEWK